MTTSKANRVGATKTVGGSKAPDKKKRSRKTGKSVFNIKDAKVLKDGKMVSAVNEKGKLIAVPVPQPDHDYEGFDPKKHKPLKQDAFATSDVYMDYRAFTLREKASANIDQAEKLERRAERFRQFGDEKTRKKANKLAKMREQLAKLEAELEAENVDLDLIED